MGVNWGHPRSGSKRRPEWASRQARPGEQKEELPGRSEGSKQPVTCPPGLPVPPEWG